MGTSIYSINKGVNQALEFKGLKAQYIWYLAIGLLLLMFLFALLYYLNIPSYICVLIIAVLGSLLLMKTFQLSRTYGQFGLMKLLAKRQLPKQVKCHHRAVFRLEKC